VSMVSPPYRETRALPTSGPNTPSTTNLASLDGLFPSQSSTLGSSNIHISNFKSLFPHPFSWTRALDWTSIKTFIKDNEAIIRYPDAQSMRLAALSYQTNPISTICASSDAAANLAQYLVSALLNNLQSSSDLHAGGISSWLGKLPQPVILQFLKALPPGHSDVFRERIFVAAMNAQDAATVQSALESGFDIHQAIDFGSHAGPQRPLVIASIQCDYPVARTIVIHASHVVDTHQLDDVLDQLISGFEGHYRHHPDCPTKCSVFKWSELLRILLDAGAKLTTRCLKVAVEGDVKLVRCILDLMGGQSWMEARILQDCLDWKSRSKSPKALSSPDPFAPNPHIRLIFSYVLEEKLDEIQSIIPESTVALRGAFRSAIRHSCIWAIDMILSAALHLKIGLGSLTHDDITNASIVSAYRDSDWELLRDLTQETEIKVRKPMDGKLLSLKENAPRGRSEHAVIAYEKLIPDWDLLLRHLDILELSKTNIEKLDVIDVLDSGCSPGFDNILVALAVKLDRAGDLRELGLFKLFRGAKTSVISQIISQNQHWNHALLSADRQHNFDDLVHLLYHRDMLQDGTGFPGQLSIESDVHKQVALRVLSCHAIDTYNESLLRWLLQMGLSTCELFGYWNIDRCEVVDLSERAPCTPPELGYIEGHVTIRLPSLLAIAASQNNARMIRLLLDEGVESKDSYALMRAVAGKADEDVIEMLLAAVGHANCRTHYGGSALRAAVVLQTYDMLKFLSDKVDIDSIESLTMTGPDGKLLDLYPLSPLGESILRRDLKAAEILIKNRANVCGLVTLDHYDSALLRNTRGSIMKRATTLLAAIDSENLHMVKLLVENGADVDHIIRPGLIRTPVQRAAEIGSFEIVQYLLERGASPNSAPCYSGGTPLQLTAIRGYVGIAELLLEYGASINHLPTEGNGKTAFESAAEWGRIDMMCFLVSKGLDFDLVVDEEGHTQYERALVFAEKNGKPASRRFVQHLREESGVDVIDWPAVMRE
jgi:ankyrin repeat protein